MQRQQELYEKSKSTYDKASRGGLKVKEPPPSSSASKPASVKSNSPPPKKVEAGDKPRQAHPADVAAAAKPQVARPTSAVQSPKSLVSPKRTSDVPRQGSKVADLSRQFSQAADIARQGSGGSDVSRQDSKMSNLSRQGSVCSPQKQGLGRQASTASSVITSSPPATSAAVARAMQLADSPASSSQAEHINPQTSSIQSLATPDAAASATRADAVQPTGALQEQEPLGTSAIAGAGQSFSKPADALETKAAPAALANFAKILLLQSRAPTSTQSGSSQIQAQEEAAIMPTDLDQPRDSLDSILPSTAVSSTSGDVRIAMPAQEYTSNETVQSTLQAVQEDFVQMMGEQEEDRQAAAAEAASHNAATALTDYDVPLGGGAAVTGTSKAALIPALPLNPRTTARRGNNALFQMLARGQSGDPQDMGDMFAAEEASGVNKRELYKQNKEAQLMERLERRMEGNIRPVAPLLQPGPEVDSSPEAVAKAFLSHVPEPGLTQGSPRLPPPAAESTADLQTEPLPEPDLRQCYQIVNGRLTTVPLQLVLLKPKPKGAIKKGLAAGGAAGTDAS